MTEYTPSQLDIYTNNKPNMSRLNTYKGEIGKFWDISHSQLLKREDIQRIPPLPKKLSQSYNDSINEQFALFDYFKIFGSSSVHPIDDRRQFYATISEKDTEFTIPIGFNCLCSFRYVSMKECLFIKFYEDGEVDLKQYFPLDFDH